ncbi:hypothetical protein MTR_8g106830 [Medicago truncatula]|uniref:Uncharacterized protein n=1 Tax=Medicago truncatula TaxID=3880 RepID=A4PRI2_MEDTR|nr:hypothetical protein MtrDRAFT_AC139526g51v2 [Medicago truncatula]AET05550.1 hypothetical protein MTR_8g106830 [Medicago truncatula]
MVVAKSEANSKAVLTPEDIFIIYCHCLQVDRVAMLLHFYMLYHDSATCWLYIFF